MKNLHFFKPIKAYSETKIVLQTLVLMQLLLVSTVTNAIAPNPGATCPSGYFQGKFSDANYTSILNNRANYTTITGNANIPLKVNIVETLTGTTSSSTTNRTTVNNSNSGNYAFNSFRNFANTTSYIETTLTFQNSNTSQPIYLTNLALSAFDIDYTTANNNNFDDRVLFTGINQDGTSITGTYQSITGSNITSTADGTLYNTTTSGCTAKNLGTACQGSVVFAEPVRSVTIKYGNYNSRISGDPTNQEIDFKVDNYCYAPSAYTITKDDNTTSVLTGSDTTYTIKVTNTGGTTLNNLVLTDPAVTGLNKLSGISCDSNDTTNTCSSTSLPTIAQLQGSGYTINSLAAGKSYSIKVPVNVTAAAGSSVTNIATISGGGLTSQSAADTDSVTSVFGGGTPTPATCPAGDRMYYVGKSAPSSATALDLTWTAGNTSKTFTFPDGTTMNINFPLLVDGNTNNGGTPPFVGNIDGTTSGALNLVHNSPAVKNNHQMDITINQTVSQFGYNIQDLDSTGTTSIPYAEQVDVSSTSGKLTYYDTYHRINLTNDIVTAKNGQNCGLNGCTISATWGKKLANSTFSLVHSNEYTQYDAPHAVGYSDFYFCLSPPKLINQKILNGTRAQPSDQFTITTTGGTVNNSFTTAGTGSTIDAGTNQSSVIALTFGTSATYTITESITNSGSLTNYNTTYKCTNGSTSTSTMPSGNGSAFSLSNLNYGDEITCQITNAPKAYTFSGIVFNDNGGLTLANDLSVPVGTNKTYFNGVYDSSVETGITQTGLTIDLAKNCNTTTPTIINSATVGSDGTYSISATSTQMANATNVCLIQREPNGNLTSYPVDTTNNQANITFASTTYDYQNINFGEVSQNNAGLVLVKEQATNDCNITNTAMLGLTYNAVTQSGIDARKCVAYKITAYNRTNLTNPLTNVRITDALPKKGVNTSTVTSALVAPTDTTSANFNINFNSGVAGAVTAFGQNGTVVSNVKSLAAGANMSLYFNTKYDSSLP